MTTVYLAARFSRLPEMVAFATDLEAVGITVTSRWIRGGHEWENADDAIEVPVEIGSQFAQDDIDDIKAADVVVCFTESPRTGPARGGRHVEAGYALHADKIVMCVEHRENVFYCLPEIVFVENATAAFDWLVHLHREPLRDEEKVQALLGEIRALSWSPHVAGGYDVFRGCVPAIAHKGGYVPAISGLYDPGVVHASGQTRLEAATILRNRVKERITHEYR